MNREQHAKRVDAILDKHKNSEWLKNLWRKVTPPKPPHVEIVTTYGTLKEHHYVVPLLMAARSKPTDTFLTKIEAFIPLDAIIRDYFDGLTSVSYAETAIKNLFLNKLEIDLFIYDTNHPLQIVSIYFNDEELANPGLLGLIFMNRKEANND